MAKSIHFRQFDSRWSKKKYPSWGTGTYRYCGCGPTTCATIISSWNSKITPKIVGDYISKQKNGATKSGASYWATGVLKALRYFGGEVKAYGAVTDCFRELYEAKRKGIDLYGILDVYGTKCGVTWTGGGGHYIPITDIKKEGNDWIVYVKDPSLRKNDGWYSYRKHMQGHIKLCATVKKAGSTQKQTPSTSLKSDAVIAKEVIDGKWGSGEERKKKLKAAGYNYEAAQKAVNNLLKQIDDVKSVKPKTSTSGSKVKIAHATSSGSVGCKTRTWYHDNNHGKWLYIMRPKDESLAEAIAKAALEATKNSHIKYDKKAGTHKGSLAKALKANGYKMSAIKSTAYTVCTDFQMCCVLCASPEIRKDIKDVGAWAWAGHKGVESKLSATGRFLKITDKNALTKGIGLKKGDLIVSAEHGVVVVEV